MSLGCRYRIERLMAGKLVFLCTPVDPTTEEKPFVAKLIATPYSEELHRELSVAQLAPALLAPVQTYPGRQF